MGQKSLGGEEGEVGKRGEEEKRSEVVMFSSLALGDRIGRVIGEVGREGGKVGR